MTDKTRKNIAIVIGAGFGSGFCPVAPGTAGALLAALIWLALSLAVPPLLLAVLTAVLCCVFTILGVWAANTLEPYWGEDPKRVVVDEMVGVWIPLVISPAGSLWYVLAAFVLFRFFDIVKPLGVRRMEKLPGGIGVMADDILAGIYSLIIIAILQWAHI